MNHERREPACGRGEVFTVHVPGVAGGGGGGGTSDAPPKPSPEIHRELERLMLSIGACRQVTDELVKRLEPVLRKEDDGKASAEEIPETDLGRAIRHQTRSVDAIRCILASALCRLEV